MQALLVSLGRGELLGARPLPVQRHRAPGLLCLWRPLRRRRSRDRTLRLLLSQRPCSAPPLSSLLEPPQRPLWRSSRARPRCNRPLRNSSCRR